MSSEEYYKAKKRVKRKKEFYQHLTAYLIIIGFLFTLNMLVDPYDSWFIFPALGWGVGLAFHFIGVFGLPGTKILTSEWEEREIEKEMDKLNRYDRPAKKYKKEEEDIIPDEELELKEFKKLRKEWDDSDFV